MKDREGRLRRRKLGPPLAAIFGFTRWLEDLTPDIYRAHWEALSYVGFSPPARFLRKRKYEIPRRGTETDVTQGLHGRHIWLHSVTRTSNDVKMTQNSEVGSSPLLGRLD